MVNELFVLEGTRGNAAVNKSATVKAHALFKNYFKTKTTIRIYAQIFVFKDCIFNLNCCIDMDRLQKQ